MVGYVWTDDMGEISGFGGAYEAACRSMLDAGLTWLDARSKNGGNVDLRVRTVDGVYGIMDADSDDAKSLEEAVTSAQPDCSGAMHYAVMGICVYVAKNGWQAYAEAKRKSWANHLEKRGGSR